MSASRPTNVWISGASSGIGRALAVELARRGANLAIFARRVDALDETRRAILAANPESRVILQPGDAGKRSSVVDSVHAADDAFGALGGLDTVILNAGIGDSLFPDRFDAELIERVFRVNLLGAVWGIEAVLPRFLERGHGRIVGVSSIGAVRGFPTAAPYCASKAALTTFLESLRIDLRGRGVTVTTVSPGFVKTPLTDRNRFPMPFIVSSDEAARRIANGIERGKREIAFPRRLTIPMKLLRCLPGVVYDWFAASLLRPGYGKDPEPP
jgi:NAD(P)-dependent dehydrogenase (short-subunit alcohol dehydrogenase family)